MAMIRDCGRTLNNLMLDILDIDIKVNMKCLHQGLLAETRSDMKLSSSTHFYCLEHEELIPCFVWRLERPYLSGLACLIAHVMDMFRFDDIIEPGFHSAGPPFPGWKRRTRRVGSNESEHLYDNSYNDIIDKITFRSRAIYSMFYQFEQ
jgi:hypothetical protein